MTDQSSAIIKTTDLPPETPTRVSDIIIKTATRIAQALPKHIEAQRFIRSAVLAAVRDPKLLKACEANPISLAAAVLEAAELGLDFSPALGLAALVPFNIRTKDENNQWRSVPTVTMIPMYRGLATLARRTCNVQITSDCVFEGDLFKHKRGTEPGVEHEPAGETKSKEKITHAYAVAHYPDGRKPQFVVMTRDQIEDIRIHFSKQSDGKLWGGSYCPEGERDNNYHEACRKTVIRRLCKEIDLSPELMRAIEMTDREFDRAEVRVAPPEGRQEFGFRPDEAVGAEPIIEATDGTGTTDNGPSTEGDDDGQAEPSKSSKAGKGTGKGKSKAGHMAEPKPEPGPEPEPQQEPEPEQEFAADVKATEAEPTDEVPDVAKGDRWPMLVDMVAAKLSINMDAAEVKLADWLAKQGISYLAVKKPATWLLAYAAVTAEAKFNV